MNNQLQYKNDYFSPFTKKVKIDKQLLPPGLIGITNAGIKKIIPPSNPLLPHWHTLHQTPQANKK